MSGYIAKGTALPEISWKGSYLNGFGDLPAELSSDGLRHPVYVARDGNGHLASIDDRVTSVVESCSAKGLLFVSITGRKNAQGETLLPAVIANWRVAWAANENYPHVQALIVDGTVRHLVDLDAKTAQNRGGCPDNIISQIDLVYDKVWRLLVDDQYSPMNGGIANFVMPASALVKGRLSSVSVLRPQILTTNNGLSPLGSEVVLLTISNVGQMMALRVLEEATKMTAYAYGKWLNVGGEAYFSSQHPAVRRALGLPEPEEFAVPSVAAYPAMEKLFAKQIKPWVDQCWNGLCVYSHRGWWEEATLSSGLKPRIKTGITKPEWDGDFLYCPVGWGFFNVSAPANLFLMVTRDPSPNEDWQVEMYKGDWIVLTRHGQFGQRIPVCMGWNDVDGREQTWSGDTLTTPYGWLIPKTEPARVPVLSK